MTLHAPQIIMIVMLALALGLAWESHGQPKTGFKNAWTDLIAVLIHLGLLYWGGFFNQK